MVPPVIAWLAEKVVLPAGGLETSFEFVASICRIFDLLPRGRKASLNGLPAYAKWQFGLGVKLPTIWLG